MSKIVVSVVAIPLEAFFTALKAEFFPFAGQMFCYCVLSCAFKKWIILSEDSEIASLECRVTLFEVLVNFKARQNDLSHFLFLNCPLNDVCAAQLSLNLALIQIMVSTVANFPEHIDNELWDTILCSMLDWLQVHRVIVWG